MPIVNGIEYPYTPEGMARARAADRRNATSERPNRRRKKRTASVGSFNPAKKTQHIKASG